MDGSESEVSRLLRRLHAEERDALETLLERHLPAIRSRVHARLGPMLRRAGDTGDYVQEALLQFLRHGPRFLISDERHFRLLMAKIVENVLRDQHDYLAARRRAIAREHPLLADSVLDLESGLRAQTSPSEAASRREQEAWVRMGMELLEPEDRDVLWLRRWDGLPFAEIAQRLHIASGAARMRYQRALVRLAEKVDTLRRGSIEGLVEETPA